MVTGKIDIPAGVTEAVSRRWPELAPAWLDGAPDELGRLCERFGGRPVRTFQGRYGFVVEVATAHGPLVLRSTPDPLGMRQAEVSQELSRLDVGPRIYDVLQTPISVWTVAERICPGNSLGGEGASLEQLAPLFNKMLNQKVANDRIPTLADWLRSRLDDDNLNDLAPGTVQASLRERQRALSVLKDLETGAPNMTCHGDTSSGNILIGPDGRLFLIDPRGVSGDVCYDVAIAAWKTARGGGISSRAANLARTVGVDAERVQAWLEVGRVARV
ncbi:phosphotransferase [Actinomadura nitritigenes]|uniref:phosphotransferase n=1 Tax=Actinomadura nitritigenes TaxID=134602 RepID=UPI003D94087D